MLPPKTDVLGALVKLRTVNFGMPAKHDSIEDLTEFDQYVPAGQELGQRSFASTSRMRAHS